MDKKVVKIKQEEKKLREDMKQEAKIEKTKPESKTLKIDDVAAGKGIKDRLFFNKYLPINNEKKRTAFHDALDKELKNFPEIKGNHIKKVIASLKVLIDSEYKLRKGPYKDRDERFEDFQNVHYVCNEIAKFYALRSATGDKTAYKKVLIWTKDTELLNNTWIHINSRASVESKQKIINLFVKSMKLTSQRLK